MTYRAAIEYLFGLQLFGATLALENPRRLAAAAGNPETKLRFIHVAGTNGKGSTCAILEAIYRAAGLRVGLYTSPHLVSFRERLQVNRELISEPALVDLVQRAMNWIESVAPGSQPTFFEVVTVMALAWFHEQQCDLVIWETGLGGRLDATNIVNPLASVITNVQFDHEKWLGDTIERIAIEKAGIIKPHIPVITAAADPAALAVIRATAAQLEAPLHVVTPSHVDTVPEEISLAGPHQKINAATALLTVDILRSVLPVNDEAIRHGLAHAQWPGRFETVRRSGQTLILDGAHNPAGAEALAETMRREHAGKACTLIIGVLQDKNWKAVCHTLAHLATRIIATPVSSPRTESPAAIAEVCRSANPQAVAQTAHSVCDALEAAKNEPLVLVTGSLYLIGEAMEVLGKGPPMHERQLNHWTQPPQPSRTP